MQERENNVQQTSVSRGGVPLNNTSGYKRVNQSNIRSEARSQVTERHSQRSQNTRSQRRPLSRISREQRSTQRSERKSCNASNRSKPQHLSHQSSYTTVYKKVTESNVTNANNLVCDFCINKEQYQKKLDDLERQRQEDVEFAQEVNKRLQEELEAENKKLAEKRRIYMEAIMNQQKDNENKRQLDMEKEREENEKFNEMMKDNSDLLKKQAEENERKRKFINSLKGQIQDKEKQNLNDKLIEAEVDKNSPNLLINDAWRIPQREAMKEYYLNNLVNQIKEKEGKDKAEHDKEEREKQEYRNELDNLIKEDEAKMKALEAEKRRIFLDEIQKQLQDKDKQNQKQQQLKDMEDAMVRAKLEKDDQKTRDNLFKKKQEMQKYLDDLVGQKYYDDIKKKEEALKQKSGKNTGLDLGKKHMNCYNCANCLGLYPLKQLNKKRRVHV